MQGEGDRISARHSNRDVREFIAEGEVEEAAQDAKLYVERDPKDAARAEAEAKRGPHGMHRFMENLKGETKALYEHYRQKSAELFQRLRRR